MGKKTDRLRRIAGFFVVAAIWIPGFSCAAEPEYAANRTPAGLKEFRVLLSKLAFDEQAISTAERDTVNSKFRSYLAAQAIAPSDWRMLFNILFKTGSFELIREYQMSSPVAARMLEDSEIPTGIDGMDSAAEPFWNIDTAARSLRHLNDRWDSGHLLLVVFHPLCNPCRRFASDVASDAQLQRFMRTCSRWVGTVEGNFSIESYRAWARKHPDLRPTFIRDWSYLGLAPTYTTPTMLLFKNGALAGKHLGWPRDTGKSDLESFLRQHAMTFDQACKPLPPHDRTPSKA